MSGGERCDEILRLIDGALAEQERADLPWRRAKNRRRVSGGLKPPVQDWLGTESFVVDAPAS